LSSGGSRCAGRRGCSWAMTKNLRPSGCGRASSRDSAIHRRSRTPGWGTILSRMLTSWHISAGDADKRGDVAAQIEQRSILTATWWNENAPMETNSGTGRCGRVQRVGAASRSMPGLRWHRACGLEHQPLRHSHRCASRGSRWPRPGWNAAPESGTPWDRAWQAVRSDSFDVAQALAIGQLGKGHGANCSGATEAAHPVVAIITGTLRANEVQGRKSINCANSNLPASPPPPETISGISIAQFQIDTT